MTQTLTLLEALIKKPSVTPNDEGCQDLIAQHLTPLGFVDERLDFDDTQNIWLRRGQSAPLFVFLGHTDVVPPGPLDQWDSPPFEPTIKGDLLYGRGTADMKGGIACFITACERFIAEHPDHAGSIALMITSDEEGIATNGVVKVIDVLERRHEKIDWCLVGEPTAEKRLGDVIKIGRRGSINVEINMRGIQGHAAYPHNAENPIHTSSEALNEIVALQWPDESGQFPDSVLQVSNIKSGTGAHNVIPGELSLKEDVRYSPSISSQTVIEAVEGILQKHKLNFSAEWEDSGAPFLTTSTTLIDCAIESITNVTGVNEVEQSTAG